MSETPDHPDIPANPNPPPPLPRFEFMAALIMGCLLLLVAVPTISYSWMPVAFSSAILAVSIAVVLYAFGSYVRISSQWLLATGCAAVMFATYFFINQQHAKESVEILVESEGSVFSQPKALIESRELASAQVTPQYDPSTGRTESGQLRIYLRAGRDIFSANQAMYLSLLFAGNNEATKFRDIPTDVLYRSLGSTEPVRWVISKGLTKLYAVRRESGRFTRVLIIDLEDPTTRTQGNWMLPDVVSSAWAQTITPCDQVSQFEMSFKSESTETRRASRAAAAKLGPCIVKPLMVMYDRNPNDYRVQLSVAVALSGMLNSNKNQRKLVDDSLTQDNINELTNLAVHQDRTLRIYAAEFLYDLGSSKTIEPLVKVAQQIEEKRFQDENAAFNLALIATNVYQFADPSGRQKLLSVFGPWVGKVGDKTEALVKKLRP